VGQSTSCAIRIDRTAWCWGHNGDGQLGVGDNTTRTSPTQVSTLLATIVAPGYVGTYLIE